MEKVLNQGILSSLKKKINQTVISVIRSIALANNQIAPAPASSSNGNPTNSNTNINNSSNIYFHITRNDDIIQDKL